MNRRSFLKTTSAGLVVAASPAIVRAEWLMPVKVVKPVVVDNAHYFTLTSFHPRSIAGGVTEWAVTGASIDDPYARFDCLVRLPNNADKSKFLKLGAAMRVTVHDQIDVDVGDSQLMGVTPDSPLTMAQNAGYEDISWSDWKAIA